MASLGSPFQSATYKGRGATYDPHNRFSPTHSEAEDDGWCEETSTTIATEIREEVSKSALSWNKSPDLPFDRSLNPIAAVSTVAFTATPVPLTPTGIYRQGWILKPS
jgi:hypothetical protein